MTQMTKTVDREELAAVAARLRLAITRTSRRLRQEAGTGLSPSRRPRSQRSSAAGRSRRRACRERARPAADELARRQAARGGAGRATADPADGAPPWCRSPARAPSSAPHPYAQERLSRRRLSKLDCRRPRRARARGRRARAHPRGRSPVTQALHRLLRSAPSVPNYRRYFAGQVVSVSGNWMQMVAETWLMLELTGSGVAVGHHRGRPVPPDPPVRRLRRADCRPL